MQQVLYPSGYGAGGNFCCADLLFHSREIDGLLHLSSLPEALGWGGRNADLFLVFCLFLSKALVQKLLFIITSIKPWDSILASSILLLKNKHFSSIKIAIQLFFCLHGNFKHNNKAVGDVVSQRICNAQVIVDSNKMDASAGSVTASNRYRTYGWSIACDMLKQKTYQKKSKVDAIGSFYKKHEVLF